MTNDAHAPARQPSASDNFQKEQEIDFRQVFELLQAGRWVILSFVVGALLLGLLYVKTAVPIYQASGLIQVNVSDGGFGGFGGSGGSGGASGIGGFTGLPNIAMVQPTTAPEIIPSALVLNQVIDKLGLLVSVEPRYFPFVGFKMANRNRNAKHPVTPPLFLGKYSWGGEHIEVGEFQVPAVDDDSAYTLTATADGYRLADASGTAVLAGKVGQLASAQTAGGAIKLRVDKLTARVGEQFFVTHRSQQSALARIQGSLEIVEQGKFTGVFRVSYSNPDRMLAKDIVNAVEDAYVLQNVQYSAKQAEKSLKFLHKQLPEVRARLDAAQLKLAKFQRAHGAVDIATETGLLLNQSITLETARSKLMQQRALALQRFTPNNPAIQGLDSQIAEVERDEGKLRNKISVLPTVQQDILGLTNDLEVNKGIYTNMLNTVESLKVTQAGSTGNIRVVDYAMVPLRAVSPRSSIILALALLLGAMLGVAWIIGRRALLRGVDDPVVIEDKLGINVLASIPYAREQSNLGRLMKQDKPGSHLLALLEQDNPAIEALRSLRTSLHFAMLEAPNNIVMFTGVAPGSGKSFTSANFAAVLAMTGKRVVVVDADLRKGHLNRYFGTSYQPGISDWIAGDLTSPSQTIQTILTGSDNRPDLVPRGRHMPNAAEVLAHERFKVLVDALSAKYDYVILDTPPILAVTDAAIIGKLAGTTLLVLKSAEHSLREITESVSRLTAAGIQVRGILMNKVGAKAGSYGHGNYGYHYYGYK